jgi:hypothetical protein
MGPTRYGFWASSSYSVGEARRRRHTHVQYGAAQCSTVQCSAAQCSPVQHSVVQCSTVLKLPFMQD